LPSTFFFSSPSCFSVCNAAQHAVD
jgi:hypothetical protein